MTTFLALAVAADPTAPASLPTNLYSFLYAILVLGAGGGLFKLLQFAREWRDRSASLRSRGVADIEQWRDEANQARRQAESDRDWEAERRRDWQEYGAAWEIVGKPAVQPDQWPVRPADKPRPVVPRSAE